MDLQKGNTSIIIGVIGFAVVAVLGYLMISGTMSNQTTEKEVMMEDKTDSQVQKDETAMKADETSMDAKDTTMKSGYKGKVLAGTTTPFIDFNQSDYEKALSENKIILLDFYANWCPVCRGEAPIMEGGFNGLQNKNMVGFRVNYNDPETDEFEKELAKKYEVTYQHTKVILKEGKQILKDGAVWDSETFTEQVNSVL